MEIISLLGGALGILGGICATIVPVLVRAGLGKFLYRRSQQGQAAEVAAQS